MDAIWLTLLLAGGLTLLFSILQSRIGLNLCDEGYLWYGVIRTAAGDVPKRDFRAYDPLRYYWASAWCRLFGLGIVGLRRATDVFQMLGLWVGLLVLLPVVDNWTRLSLLGVTLILWMQPRHKRFDHVTSIVAVGVALWLISQPVTPVFVMAGVFTGLAAYMGRNHGVYCFAAMTLAMVFIGLRLGADGLPLQFAAFLAGIVAGYAPMWLRWVFVRGAFRSYWRNDVLAIFRRRSLNLGLPVPWPWKVPVSGRKISDVLADVLVGLVFLAMPLFYVGSLAFCFSTANLSGCYPLAAASLVGLFYMHHAFARSDMAHLCQAIQPFLIAVAAAVFGWGNDYAAVGYLALTLVASVIALKDINPLIRRYWRGSRFRAFHVRGERLQLPRGMADYLDGISAFAESHISADERVFIAPNRATLYPLLGRDCPVYSTFLVGEEFPEKQQEMADELTRGEVAWALVVDQPQDGRDELRFCNTHPLLWSYIQQWYEPVHDPALRADHTFFRRKAA